MWASGLEALLQVWVCPGTHGWPGAGLGPVSSFRATRKAERSLTHRPCPGAPEEGLPCRSLDTCSSPGLSDDGRPTLILLQLN